MKEVRFGVNKFIGASGNLSLYIDLDCITQHPLLDKLLDGDVLEVMLSVIVDITRGSSETTPK